MENRKKKKKNPDLPTGFFGSQRTGNTFLLKDGPRDVIRSAHWLFLFRVLINGAFITYIIELLEGGAGWHFRKLERGLHLQ